MSTISLMPVNKKIKLTKDCKFNMKNSYGSSSIGDATKILKQAGMLVSDELILDAGVKMRIESFKAQSSVKGWPFAKITVYPEGSKSCQCYIEFSEFDGISWEAEEEEEQKPKKEVQRINVSFEKYEKYIKDFNNFPCWHNAFKDGFRTGEKDKPLNPLALTSKEIEKGLFMAEVENTLGEAVVKKGKNSYLYDIRLRRVFCFKITTKPGFMYANLSETREFLEMRKSYSSGENWFEITRFNLSECKDIKELRKPIVDFLKKEHQIETN